MGSSFRTLLVVLIAVHSVNSLAAGLALENALVSRNRDGATIVVRLHCAHRYVDHTPTAASTRARVSLAPVDGCAARTGAGTVRDASRPAGRELADLDELEYVSRAGTDGFLTLSFSRPVTIQVQQRGDLRLLTIQVRPADIEVADSTMADILPPEAGTARGSGTLARTPERVRNAEARAQRAMQPGKATADRGLYAINLDSSKEPLAGVNSAVPQAAGWQFYSADTQVAGQTWYRLRLGFFSSEAEAETALRAIKADFPRAWITRVPVAEHQVADASPVAPAPAVAEQVPAVADSAPLSAAAVAIEMENVEALMTQGREALIGTDYPRAIQIYTRVLREPENQHTADALEFLALARERNNQRAHAVAEYRRYLELYPEGDGAMRVRQRLAGLTAVAPPPSAGARRPSRRAQAASNWNFFGGLSQYYRRDENEFNDQDRITSQSSILSDLDVIANRQGERYQFASRATMGNLYDLLGDDEGPGTSSRVYFLYADLLDDVTGIGARLGRQSLRTAGVLGRFDGAHLSWQWRPGTRFNVLGGFPAESSGEGLNSDQVFYGLSVDLLDIQDLFDLSLFYNTQDVNEIDDREAVGGELRYYDEYRSLIANVDYDVSYGELNNLTVMGTWSFDHRITLNALVDHRKSPFLTTRNALIGQPVEDIEDLLLTLSQDEIRDLALDRTGEMNAITLGLSTPVFERFQFNADVTMNDYDGTVASGGVAEVPDLGTEYYYSMNLIGSSLWKEGDSSILGLRYADGVNAATTLMFLETRLPITRGLRINPRMRLSYREFSRDDSTEWSVMPGIRVLYRVARRYTFELETGSEWSSRDLESDSADRNSFFIYAGYRADF